MSDITTSIEADTAAAWKNWYGNISCEAIVIDVSSEADIVDAVLYARGEGLRLRAAGTGHSNVPLVSSNGVVLRTERLTGLVAHDAAASTATFRGGTKIHDIGDALWAVGLALSNQGDIDTQAIAGALATGTHGTGLKLQSLSSTITQMRLVDSTGQISILDESDPARLRAGRVSMGMLGVVSEVTMKVSKAYHLHEWVAVMPFELAAEIELEMCEKFRHFGYFWCSTPESTKWLGVDGAEGDVAYVRIFHPEPIEVGELEKYCIRRRHDRSYRIYPEVYTPDFHEMEYMVPLAQGAQCFRELKTTLKDRFDEIALPAEMRFTAGDDNYLSEYFGGPRVAISVSGRMGLEEVDFFRACDEIFARYDGRSHWGKIHFLDRNRLQHVYPRHETFVEIRRELDPDGIFLNDYLEPLFG